MAEPETLILTRPRAQAEAFATAVEAAMPGRFAVLVAPLMTIAPVAGALDLDGLQGIVFSSANGVEQFAARSAERRFVAWCVGDMTAAAARAAGFEAVSADGDVDDLAALVIAANRPGAGAFLHVRGRHAAGDLLGALAAAGVPARAAEIYDQVPRPIEGEARARLAAGDPAVVALFSPRSARLFAAQALREAWPLARVTAVALSPAADAALAGLPLGRRIVAATPGRAGILAALAGI
jgi:uroporphyrinogen-III synthase